MPRIRIDWRYTASDVHTVQRVAGDCWRGTSRSAASGTLDLRPGRVEAEMTRYGAYGGHHIGTARMGTRPAPSVVDADCRVHGVDNLFVAGIGRVPDLQPGKPDADGGSAGAAARGTRAQRGGPMSAGTLLVYGAGSPLGKRVMEMLASSADLKAVAAESLAPDALRTAVGEAQAVLNATTGAPAAIQHAAARLAEVMGGAAPGKRLVHVSSMTVYGERTGLCEVTSPSSGSLPAYAAAHVAAEAIARAHPDTVVLRPGVEYGPGCEAWSGRIARWLQARRIGDLGAGGDGYCNLIFIDDLVRAVLAATRAPALAGRVFNVAMRDPPTWNGYLVGFGVALGAIPVRRMTRRRWDIETKLLAPPLKVAELTIGRVSWIAKRLPPAIPPSFRRLCSQEIRLEVGDTEAALGVSWMPLSAGLQAAAAAYRGSLSSPSRPVVPPGADV